MQSLEDGWLFLTQNLPTFQGYPETNKAVCRTFYCLGIAWLLTQLTDTNTSEDPDEFEAELVGLMVEVRLRIGGLEKEKQNVN